MTRERLRDFREVIRDLANQYGVPEELVEEIIVEWARILFFTMTGREAEGASQSLDTPTCEG